MPGMSYGMCARNGAEVNARIPGKGNENNGLTDYIEVAKIVT